MGVIVACFKLPGKIPLNSDLLKIFLLGLFISEICFKKIFEIILFPEEYLLFNDFFELKRRSKCKFRSTYITDTSFFQ